MQFDGQIFRELTFHSKATSEKQKFLGPCEFLGQKFQQTEKQI
jgi:hypothetical protein